MKNKTWIIILFVLLVLSMLLNIVLSYAIQGIDMEWEAAYEKNDILWCDISNMGNELINDLLDELKGYNEYYEDIPHMAHLDCFS